MYLFSSCPLCLTSAVERGARHPRHYLSLGRSPSVPKTLFLKAGIFWGRARVDWPGSSLSSRERSLARLLCLASCLRFVCWLGFASGVRAWVGVVPYLSVYIYM